MRHLRAVVVIAVALGGVVVAAGPAAAAAGTRCDFDGDGAADLAVGVPGEDEIGAVNVQYQRTGPLADPAILREDWLPRGSDYGTALTCGDFDADGIGDLAVGAPGAYDGSGKVFVYSGRADVGLGSDAMLMFSQGSGTPGHFEDHDRMGWSLASGDLDGDSVDDLVVGIPGDADPGWRAPRHRMGSVLVIHGSDDGLRFDDSVEQLFSWLEYDDEEFLVPPHFGWSVAVGQFARGGAAELAVGAPYASPRSFPTDKIAFEGGRVYTFHDDGGLEPDRILEQDGAELWPGSESYEKFGWSLAAGDFDADGHADLAVGVPFEDVGDVKEAGQVSVFGGSSTGLGGAGPVDAVTTLQGGGELQAGDWFGFSVAAGDYDGDGRADLAVGAPHRTVREAPLAGAAYLLAGTSALIGSGLQVVQGGPGLPGTAHQGERLGMSVALVALSGSTDLVVGAPGEQCPSALPDGCRAGAVMIVPSEESDRSPLLLHQDTKAPTPVSDRREPAWAVLPVDDTRGEVLDGPQPAEPAGEWFGWAVAS
jgi:hypothetical protein